jgi:choline dehydrogenase-like flavoprotein
MADGKSCLLSRSFSTALHRAHYGPSSSAWHAVGTASLSAVNANSGVVGPDLRVKGTIGLRVADGSVLPVVPSGHPTGPIFIVGELAAEFIKSGN